MRVGERAIVIGNPYDLPTSVTMGVVSALRKNVKINDRVYTTLIQTDAAINPGNSGGALLDGDGNLLGIVTAVYEEGKGIGFAIPIEDVMAMLSEFLEHAGRRPIFGVFVEKRGGRERPVPLRGRGDPRKPGGRVRHEGGRQDHRDGQQEDPGGDEVPERLQEGAASSGSGPVQGRQGKRDVHGRHGGRARSTCRRPSTSGCAGSASPISRVTRGSSSS